MPRETARMLGGCRWSPMARALIRLRLSSAMRLPASWRTQDVGKPIVIEAGLSSEEGCPGGHVPQVQPDAVSFSYGKVKAYFLTRGYREGVEHHQPGFQLGDWPGQVHGTIRAQCPSGGCPGAGPSFTRLLRAHSAPSGCTRWQWRPCRLHRTCKEASEARVDVLGCDPRQLRPALAAQYRLERRRRRSNPAQAGPQVQACGVA